jgi:hypothetical protein
MLHPPPLPSQVQTVGSGYIQLPPQKRFEGGAIAQPPTLSVSSLGPQGLVLHGAVRAPCCCDFAWVVCKTSRKLVHDLWLPETLCQAAPAACFASWVLPTASTANNPSFPAIVRAAPGSPRGMAWATLSWQLRWPQTDPWILPGRPRWLQGRTQWLQGWPGRRRSSWGLFLLYVMDLHTLCADMLFAVCVSCAYQQQRAPRAACWGHMSEQPVGVTWLDCGADQVALWLHDRMFRSLQLS